MRACNSELSLDWKRADDTATPHTCPRHGQLRGIHSKGSAHKSPRPRKTCPNPVPTAIISSASSSVRCDLRHSPYHAPGKCASNATDNGSEERSNVDAFYRKAGADILNTVCNTTAFPKPNGIYHLLVSVMQHGQKAEKKSQC